MSLELRNQNWVRYQKMVEDKRTWGQLELQEIILE